jgi:hypothetical protein
MVLISLVGAGFAGGASTVVFEYLKNRKKNKDKSSVDHYHV